jgi:hypothetical protein
MMIIRRTPSEGLPDENNLRTEPRSSSTYYLALAPLRLLPNDFCCMQG